VIRRGIALTKESMISVDDLPDELVSAAGQGRSSGAVGYFDLREEHMARFDRQYLNELLVRHHGDVRTAAEEAKLPRGTLYRFMKKYGLDGGQYR
jgi:transcriptional regulator of acetoin/glycerol metabolism